MSTIIKRVYIIDGILKNDKKMMNKITIIKAVDKKPPKYVMSVFVNTA